MTKVKVKREKVVNLLEKWVPRLGMDAWEIDVRIIKGKITSSSGINSSVGSVRNMMTYRATIEFSENYLFAPKELGRIDLERSVIHELLHIGFAEIVNIASDVLTRYCVSSESASMYDEQFEGAEERLCDRLAISLLRWDRKVKVGSK